MAGPSSALVLKFGTDFADAQKSLASFAANAGAQLANIGVKALEAKKTFDTVSGAITALKSVGAGELIATGLTAVAGFEALKFAIDATAKAAADAEAQLQKLVDIGTKAQGAGVGTTFFQSWTQQAKDLNLQVSDLEGALNTARDASTTHLGEGDNSGASSFQDRLGEHVKAGNLAPSAETDFSGAATQEARIRVVLDLINQLQAKGAQLAAFDLAGKFFGSTFESQLRNGVDMVGKMRAALDGLPAAGGERIIPQSEIENAQRMQAEIQAINDKLATGLKPIQDDIARWQQDELESMITLKGYWADIVLAAGRLYELVTSIGTGLRNLSFSSGFQEVFAQYNKLVGIGPGVGGLQSVETYGPTKPTALPAINVDPKKDASHALPKAASADKGGGGSETDAVDTYIKSLQKQAAAEAAEAATLGLGNKAKQEAIDLAKAQEAATERGTALTDAERAKVVGLADSYVAAKAKIEAYNKSQEQAKQTAEFFGQSLEGAVEKLATHSGTLKDALTGIVQALEKAAIQALILGQGPFASLLGTAPAAGATGTASVGGLFGSLVGGLSGGFGSLLKGGFSGFHAAGGTIPAGAWGIAGESGPEIVHGPAAITPTAAIVRGGGIGGATNVTHAPTYNITPADGVTPAQLAAVIDRNNKAFARNLVPTIADAQRRYA